MVRAGEGGHVIDAFSKGFVAIGWHRFAGVHVGGQGATFLVASAASAAARKRCASTSTLPPQSESIPPIERIASLVPIARRA